MSFFRSGFTKLMVVAMGLSPFFKTFAQDPVPMYVGDCTLDQFKSYLRSGDKSLFDCANLPDLLNKDLGWGRTAAHIALDPRAKLAPAFVDRLITQPKISWEKQDANGMTPVDCLIFCEKGMNPSPRLARVLKQIEDLSVLEHTLQAIGYMAFSKASSERDLELRFEYFDAVLGRAEKLPQVRMAKMKAVAFESTLIADARFGPFDPVAKIDIFLKKYIVPLSSDERAEHLAAIFTRAKNCQIFLQHDPSVNYVSLLLHHPEVVDTIDLPANLVVIQEAMDVLVELDMVGEITFLIEQKDVPAGLPSVAGTTYLYHALKEGAFQSMAYLMERLGFEKMKILYVEEGYTDLVVDIATNQEFEFFELVVDQLVSVGLRHHLQRQPGKDGKTIVEALQRELKVAKLDEYEEKVRMLEVLLQHLRKKGIE